MYSGTDRDSGLAAGPGMASEPCERGPGNRSTLAPVSPPACASAASPQAGAKPAPAKRSSSSAISSTGVAGSASRTTSATCRDAGDTTVSASRMLAPSLPDGADGPLPRGVVNGPSATKRLDLPLERRGELGVRLVERLGGGVKELAHAVQALDHLRGALVELGVGRLELLTGGVRHVTAGDQVVNQLLELGEVALDLRLARAQLVGRGLHLGVGHVNVCHCRLPFSVRWRLLPTAGRESLRQPMAADRRPLPYPMRRIAGRAAPRNRFRAGSPFSDQNRTSVPLNRSISKQTLRQN